MELLWQNGQVVMQSQNNRSTGNKRSETTPSSAGREIRSSAIDDETTPCNLFMQEDEMVSWLHYPNNDDNNLDIYLHNNNDIIYPSLPSSSSVIIPSSSSQPVVTAPSPRPPIPPIPASKRADHEQQNQPKLTPNFLHFSRPNKGTGSGSANKQSQAVTATITQPQSTVVESNDRPVYEPLLSRASRVTDSAALVSGRGSMSSFGVAGTSSAGREPETYDLSASSSPGTGGSGASASVEPVMQKQAPVVDDRKRKGVEVDDAECYSEVITVYVYSLSNHIAVLSHDVVHWLL